MQRLPRSIEESPAGFVVKPFDQLCGDLFCEAVVAEIGCDLVGIEAGDYGKRVVIKQSHYLAMPRCIIGVGNYVFEPAFGRPCFRQQPVQRAQCEALHFSNVEDLSRFEVCRDAEGVPVHVDGLVHVRRWSSKSCLQHFLLRRRDQLLYLVYAQLHSRRDLLRRRANVQHILLRPMMHFADFANVIKGRHRV